MGGIVLLVAVAAFGAWSYLCFHYGETSAVTAYKVKVEEAQKKIDAQAAKIEQDAANHITDMQASFDAGEAQAKIVTKTVYVKGQTYVQNTPVFRNPDCVIPADGLRLINDQRASLQITTAADILGVPVPHAAAGAGRQAGDVVLTEPSGHSPVGGVHPQVQQSGGSGGVPGQTVPRPPKPTPTK